MYLDCTGNISRHQFIPIRRERGGSSVIEGFHELLGVDYDKLMARIVVQLYFDLYILNFMVSFRPLLNLSRSRLMSPSRELYSHIQYHPRSELLSLLRLMEKILSSIRRYERECYGSREAK